MARAKSTKGKLKEKRGTGRGKDYTPWLKVKEVPSIGRVHRIFGLKHNRVYHFMSDLEYYYALNLFWQDNVIEIREQYPLLPLLLTKYLAHTEAIKHPQFRGKDEVMTTDLLITINAENRCKDLVRTVKYSSDIEDNPKNKRTLEKLYLEKVYFKTKNIDWAIVTEKEIDIVKAKNIDFFYQDRFWAERNDISQKNLQRMVFNFFDILIQENNNLIECIGKYSVKYKVSCEEVIPFIKYMIAKKILTIEMSNKVIRTMDDIKIWKDQLSKVNG